MRILLSIYRTIIFCCIFFSTTLSFSQDTFRIIDGRDSQAITFKLINNLIIIPVEVNGSELNFLLDTGVGNTIMFNLSVEDSLKLKNTQMVRIRGLGEGNYMDAIKSTKNVFKIGSIVNGNHLVYAIPGEEFDLASKMGITINGIIGGKLFEDFVVDINYNTNRVKFYNSVAYKYIECKKCEEFPLDFYNDKPYMDLNIDLGNSQQMDVKLLIDLGGSDALWLFEDSDDRIKAPDNYYDDYLGRGLSGNIHGKRSQLEELKVGRYSFNKVNVAYPDSLSIEHAYRNKKRNGSLGSGIIKRFRVIFDYQSKKIVFVRPSRYFNDPFVHNMSGIELSHNGSMIVPERQQKLLSGDTTDERGHSTIELLYSYVYSLKPSYRIAVIRKNSPAEKAGLKVDDILLKVNGKPSYDYKLEEIMHLFSVKEGKQIRLVIERDGVELTYAFTLQKMI